MKHLRKGARRPAVRPALALVLFGTLFALLGGGCVQAESPFFIESVVSQSCDPVSVESDRRSIGVLDVRYQCEYLAWLVLGNQLVRRGDETKLQTETSRITLESADVQILDAAGDPITTPTGGGAFTFPVSGFVDPSDSSEPGFGLTEAVLVDGGTGQFFAESGFTGYIVSRVVIHGRTLGGDAVTTAAWDFPIRVVNGDLCAKPADDTCVSADSAPTEQCLISQDEEFDCRFIGFDCGVPAVCGVP